MTELVWSSQMMREVIAPPGSADSKGERLHRAARRLGWKYSRAFAVWYADERVSLKPRELRQIEELTGVKYAQEELKQIDRLIAEADAHLMGQPENLRGAIIAALRSLASALDRPGVGE